MCAHAGARDLFPMVFAAGWRVRGRGVKLLIWRSISFSCSEGRSKQHAHAGMATGFHDVLTGFQGEGCLCLPACLVSLDGREPMSLSSSPHACHPLLFLFCLDSDDEIGGNRKERSSVLEAASPLPAMSLSPPSFFLMRMRHV